MTLLLSLLSATAYGISDFLGGVLAKRTSAWSIALVGQLSGCAGVTLLALVYGGEPTRADLAWGAVAGLGNGFGTAFLYRGLSSGRMGVVAPVSGVGAAVLPVAVGVLAGERPGVLVWLGIVAAVPAIWLVAHEPGGQLDLADPPRGSGLTDGVLAGLGFGTLFAALGQVPEDAGLLPVAVNQVVACAAIVAVAAALRSPWLPRTRVAAAGALCGLLGASATGLFLLATQSGLLTIASVMTSLYPAVTVLLAAALLRERIHGAQGIGLALCAAAVVLVAAG